MSKLTRLKKVKIPPFAMLISGLVIVGLLTAIGGIVDYNSQLNSRVTPVENLVQQTTGLNQENQPEQNKTSSTQDSSSDPEQTPGETGSPGSYATTPIATSGGGSSSSSGGSLSNNKTSYIKVFLSVSGNPKGSVTLKSTANQCQVLSHAKAQGLINSLDMRYNQGLGSYGVYVIDGVGRTDQVYWTYTVNGKPPPLGCSYIKVRNGDSVNWQYIN